MQKDLAELNAALETLLWMRLWETMRVAWIELLMVWRALGLLA
jgi:hypothetical protein